MVEKDYSKRYAKNKMAYKTPKAKNVNRFWGNATRLEFRNVSGKKGK